jgi:hypothetical protein
VLAVSKAFLYRLQLPHYLSTRGVDGVAQQFLCQN